MPTPGEIKEKINKPEKVSKACVHNIEEGIDVCWMMSKDLEKKVDELYGRIEYLADATTKLSAETKISPKSHIQAT